MNTKILILAANPKGTEPLQLDREIDFIEKIIESSSERDRITLTRGPVVIRAEELQPKLLKHKPRIVHFCGHGAGEPGLVLENEAGEAHLVSKEILARVFALFSDRIECVILNACYSQVQAEEIAKHINFVIGMSQPISDPNAIAFSRGFYAALGEKKSIKDAYQVGCNQIELQYFNLASQRNASRREKSRDRAVPEHLIPRLFTKENPTKIEQTEEVSTMELKESAKIIQNYNVSGDVKGISGNISGGKIDFNNIS